MNITSNQAMNLCSFCPKLCRHACPVATVENNESVTPWGKMKAMKMVDDGLLPMDAETMSLAYQCLECKGSETSCEIHTPVNDSLHEYRVQAFSQDVAPPAVYELTKNFQKENNPYGKDLFQKLQNAFPEEMKSPQKIAYFPGCSEVHHHIDLTRKSLKLLQSVSSEVVGLYREPIQCCGYPLYSAGDRDAFTELAEVNSYSLKEYSVIVTGSPVCIYTMETLYAQAGFPLPKVKFTTLIEFLSNHELPIQKKLKSSVIYHDPCFMGRYRGIYDAPRKLLTQVLEKPLLEFDLNRENAICCGGGGLLPVTNPKAAMAITEMKLEEAASKADVLVTSCSTCIQQLKKPRGKIKIKSLVEVLSDAL